MSEFELDFQNIDKSMSKAKRRREKFREFGTLFLGVVIGALVSLPVQLALKPLSFSNGVVRYADVVVVTNILPGQYVVITIFLGMGIVMGTILLYYHYLRLHDNLTVHIRIPDPTEEVFQQVKNHIREEANEMGLETDESDQIITCYDPGDTSQGLFSNSGSRILTVRHMSDLGILNIRFNQKDWRYEPIVKSLKEEYSSSNKY
jgi:hypothetical protein